MNKYVITCINPTELAVFKHNSHIIRISAGPDVAG